MPQLVFVGALLVTGVYQYYRITNQTQKAREARAAKQQEGPPDALGDRDSMLSRK